MKPPSNDPNRNATGDRGSSPQIPGGSPAANPTPGNPVAAPAKPPSGAPEPGKPVTTPSEPPRPDAVRAASPTGPSLKAEPGKDAPSAQKPDTPSISPVKPDLSKAEPPKPGTPDPIKGGGTDAAKAEATRIDPAKPTPVTPEPSKPEPSKPEPPKATGLGAGPQPGSRPADKPADGPIIDLKARRIPDPAETARREAAEKAASASATGPKTAPAAGASSSSGDGKARPSDAGTSASGGRPTEAAPKDGASKGGAGFGSVAAAGLIGGVLGAGLLFAVERAGILPGQSDDIAARLTTLDRTVGTLASREALASLDARVAGNEAALKPLPEAVRSAESAAREALQKAGAAPAATGDASAAAPALPADISARIDSLDQRLAALQEEPGRDASVDAKAALNQVGAGSEQVASLDARLKAVEGKVNDSAKDPAQPAASPDPNAGLGAKLTALQGEIESRTKTNAEAGQALAQKLAALQASLDERVKAATEAVQTATDASRQAVDANKAQAEETAKSVARQIQAQADRIAGLDKAVSERAETGTVQAALRVVSADRIVTALSTGAPYADALASLRNLEPGDPARLTAVAAFADKGAPTARTLAAEFRSISEKIAASRKSAQARSVAETGDISQRLMSMAESIVQVRKVDAPAAEKGPGADSTADVQSALDRGAIGEAARAFAALPEAARTEAGDFGTKLSSRAAAGEAAQALLSDAFKGLPAPAQTR